MIKVTKKSLKVNHNKSADSFDDQRYIEYNNNKKKYWSFYGLLPHIQIRNGHIPRLFNQYTIR